MILVLLVGACCFIAAFIFKRKVFSSELTEVDQSEVAIIDSLFNKEVFAEHRKSTWSSEKKTLKKSQKKELTPFNPNKYTTNDWETFGFSPKQASSLIKFKHKIKGFKKPQDLQDAFVVNDYMFRKMENLLLFDEEILATDYLPESFEDNNSSYQKKSWDDSKIDLNSANAIDFRKLYGIGEKLSSRIVKFREKLGGFSSTNQIKEVYGVSDSLYDSFKTRLEIGPKELTKLKINSCTELELKAHPYIDWKKAKLIFNYRKDWSRIANWEVLLKEKILSKEDKIKLEPYIEFD